MHSLRRRIDHIEPFRFIVGIPGPTLGGNGRLDGRPVRPAQPGGRTDAGTGLKEQKYGKECSGLNANGHKWVVTRNDSHRKHTLCRFMKIVQTKGREAKCQATFEKFKSPVLAATADHHQATQENKEAASWLGNQNALGGGTTGKGSNFSCI